MLSAPVSQFESERLFCLQSYNILDTEAECAYDEIVSLAAALADAPIALISLVDKDRQWFKSRVGLDAPQTPRELAFCAHAILEPQKPLIVEDATKDDRFFDNPLVTGAPFIRFYAGFPLVTSQGHALGTLCVIDRKPRTLNLTQIKALEVLSHSVVSQMELRKHNADLESQIEARTARAVEAQKLAEKANQEKSEFILNIGHEILTPLHAISSYAQMGINRMLRWDGEIQVENLSKINLSAERLTALLRNLLDIAAIEAGRYNYRFDSLAPLDIVRAEIDVFAEAMRAKNIVCEVYCDPSIRSIKADASTLRKLFEGLLSNAIRFSPNGSQIFVRLSRQAGNDDILVSVTDEGCGISDSQKSRIFDKLAQSQRTYADAGNTAISLALCKEIVEAHGGHIWIEDNIMGDLGYGSIFKFTLSNQALSEIESYGRERFSV